MGIFQQESITENIYLLAITLALSGSSLYISLRCSLKRAAGRFEDLGKFLDDWILRHTIFDVVLPCVFENLMKVIIHNGYNLTDYSFGVYLKFLHASNQNLSELNRGARIKKCSRLTNSQPAFSSLLQKVNFSGTFMLCPSTLFTFHRQHKTNLR